MEVEEKEGVLAVGGRNRRVHARSIVDELAQIFLMDRGSTMQCNVVDFSLVGAGCARGRPLCGSSGMRRGYVQGEGNRSPVPGHRK